MVQLSAADAPEPEARVAQGDAPGRVHVTYFTDPLCSWSWAFEPVRRRIVAEHGGGIAWTYRMGGLLPDWTEFHDPLNAVHTPAQLAPAWYHVRVTTGVPIDETIWHTDPPASSYPACIAVKAAARQGAAAEEAYLGAVRTAALAGCRNVARAEVLLELAADLEREGRIDADRFAADLAAAPARQQFAEDLRECRVQQIGRFPTFIVRGPACSRLVVGYRPAEAFASVLSAVRGAPR